MQLSYLSGLDDFIEAALKEDIGNGDHTTLSTIRELQQGSAILKVKAEGVIAGIDLAQKILKKLDPNCIFQSEKKDGDLVKKGDEAFYVSGSIHAILMGERLLLNCMQRMSGIATNTKRYVDELSGLKTRVLDTRKTTPGFRICEKWAVKIGGGENHRYGLYDMILIKDNHVDYCGGISSAIEKAKEYVKNKNLDLKIEIETRNMKELQQALDIGGIHRIMLDNYSTSDLKEAIKLIAGRYETEASGGITITNIRSYAETGVDFISVGALTHSSVSLDLSLKASFQ